MRNPSCQRCSLYRSCESVCVWGYPLQGGRSNGLMLIGEAPGAEEDRTAIPFVGRAGALLTDLLSEANVLRARTYITNSVKCRPPKNRPPETKEILACQGYLREEMEIVRPRVIVTLGKTAFTSLFPNTSRSVGTLASIRKLPAVRVKKIPVVPTYHPAACFRNPAYRADIIADLKKAAALLTLAFLIWTPNAQAQLLPQRIVAIAETQIGKGEMYADNSGPEVEKYTKGQDIAWCAAFVSWVRYRAGLRDSYFLAARSYWTHRAGKVDRTPRKGDLIVFSRGVHQGHVGIVEGVRGNSITTIEGNVGKYPARVRRFHYTLGHIKNLLGFVRVD